MPARRNQTAVSPAEVRKSLLSRPPATQTPRTTTIATIGTDATRAATVELSASGVRALPRGDALDQVGRPDRPRRCLQPRRDRGKASTERPVARQAVDRGEQ